MCASSAFHGFLSTRRANPGKSCLQPIGGVVLHMHTHTLFSGIALCWRVCAPARLDTGEPIFKLA